MAEKTLSRKTKKTKDEQRDEDPFDSVTVEKIEENNESSQKNLQNGILATFPEPKAIPIPTMIPKKQDYFVEDDDEEYEEVKLEQRNIQFQEEKLSAYLESTKKEPEIQEEPEKEVKKPGVYGPVSDEQLQKVEEIYEKQAADFITKDLDKLSPLEQDILEIAKSILKKKKYSSEIETDRIERCSELVQKLHEKCVAKLTYTKGYSSDVIFDAIKDLEEKKWIVTEHRRTKKEILESEPLLNVLQFIKDNPGTHARHTKIQDDLGISRNPFIKHVMVLEAFGLVRAVKIGRTQNYFFSELPDIFDDLVVLFQNDLVVNIINLILENPDITLTKIAERSGVYHGAIQYHIKTLKEINILDKDDDDPNIKYSINRSLLQRYLKLYKIPPFNL